MTLFPPLFFQHSLFLALAILAVALPAIDAVARKRRGSWIVCIIVFYPVSFGLYGIEEMFFREVWPTFIPMISLGLGVAIAITHRVILAIIDRSRRK